MKKWIGLAILLILAFSAGNFAYTAATGTSLMTIIGGGTDFATKTAIGYTWTTHPVGGGEIGGVEAGNLYTVIRDPDYTGDLVLTLAVTNTDDIKSHYVYLNLEIMVMDGADPSAEVTTEWLIVLEEGVTELIVPADKTGPFTVKVNDGVYRTEKGENPTTSPLFNLNFRQK